MPNGRVLARNARTLRVRCEDRDYEIEDDGEARPGDWVRAREDGRLEVAAACGHSEFPAPSSETARLSPERIRGLRARGQVLREIREFFRSEDFLEVEAPTLVPAPGLEVNIRAVEAEGGYLITSPEFAMKRLLAGGLQRIYSMPRCFRSEEEGPHHSVEFTMLEWYRAFAGLDAIMEDTESLVHRAVQAVRGQGHVRVGEVSVDVTPPWRRMRVAEAFEEWAGIPLSGDETASQLAALARQAGVDIGTATEWDDIFYCIVLERIQPQLEAYPKAVLLYDWPAPLAALARTQPENPAWAMRFEAYVGGVELANAFDELTCAAEQRRRFVSEQEERRRRGRAVYPLDERFLSALEEGLPPCAGIALGVDRLAMLAAGASSLRDVSAFVGDEL